MTTKFAMSRDINGYNGFGLAISDTKYSATIAQDVAQSLTVPDEGALGSGYSTAKPKYLAIFSYQPGASIWVAVNATAASPVGATFASSTSELNPTARYVAANDVLSFITTDTTAAIGVTFYILL